MSIIPTLSPIDMEEYLVKGHSVIDNDEGTTNQKQGKTEANSSVRIYI